MTSLGSQARQYAVRARLPTLTCLRFAYRPFEEYSESGSIGDPNLATAEKGAELADGLAAELADVLENVHEQASAE